MCRTSASSRSPSSGRGNSQVLLWATRLYLALLVLGVTAFQPQASCAIPYAELARADSPTNDSFANAVTVSGWSFQITGTTLNATAEPGEQLFKGDPPRHSVWFRWTPAESGRVVIDSQGSSSDANVAIYTGSALSNLRLVAASDPVLEMTYEGQPELYRVDFDVTADTTYFIDVDSLTSMSGAFVLRVNPTDPIFASCPASAAMRPPNDDFANAIAIATTGPRTQVVGATAGATTEPWDPRLLYLGRSVWYKWTAPKTEYVSFDVWKTDPSAFGDERNDHSPFLGIFTGNSLQTLKNVNDYHDASDNSLVSSFRATASTTYYVEVTGFCAHKGQFILRVVQQQHRRNAWLRVLNYYRSLAHLAPLTENPLFSYADYLHARYIQKTHPPLTLAAHQEDRSSRYFTYDGAIGGSSSDGSGETGVAAISQWMSAPYHATPILNPSLRTVGFYSLNTSWLFVYGEMVNNAPADYPVLWPGRNVTEPLTNFAGGEYPDPLVHCSGYSTDSGLPIVARFYGATKLLGSSFQSKGKRLARCAFQPENDVIFLIPRAPLERGGRYTVQLKTSTGEVNWSFRVSRTLPRVLRPS
jgi:hypothetical protein